MTNLVRLVVFIAACIALPAMAVPQMIVSPVGTKVAAEQPSGVKSVAQPIRFNLEELRALKPGAEVELTLPNARKHAFVFDLVRDHGGGIVSWVGYYRDADMRRKLRAIVTTGPDGTYGTIQTPDGEMRIVPGRGHDWLVDMKAESPHHPDIDVAADALAPPSRKSLKEPALLAQPEYAQAIPGVTVPKSASTSQTPPLVTIDVLFVYTAGLANKLQGSQMQTRIAQLITAANTAYSDSGIGIQLRAAGSTMVDYPDNSDDTTALNDISWGRVPALANIANLRDSVGADMVTFLRSGADLAGSGLSWIPSHPIAAGDASIMYSTMNGCTSGCEWLWIHELGHNMGNAHDRATVAWEVSALKQGESHGSYDYAYGFYTCDGAYGSAALSCDAFGGGCTDANVEPQCKVSNPARDFADIMAYFHGSTRLLQFSNPDLHCQGTDLACGLAEGSMDGTRPDSANAALSMNNNRVALSSLRSAGATASQPSSGVSLASSANPSRAGTTITLTASVAAYVNGSFTPVSDGVVRFRANGNDIAACTAVAISAGQATCTTAFPAGTQTLTAEYSGSSSYGPGTSSAVSQVVAALPAMAESSGPRRDFNGDARSDLAWASAGASAVWLMNGLSASSANSVPGPANATIRAFGDFDGDGLTDIVWRGSDGSYSISLMSGATVRSTVQILGAGTAWELVGVADLDGDGRADLLWNCASGQFGAWLMNGTSAKKYTTMATPIDNATLVSIADFNGDGLPDLLWRGADGSIALTLQASGTAQQSRVLLNGGSGWTTLRVADLDGDGRGDILLAHTDGSIAAWLMNGTAIATGKVLVDGGGGYSLAAAGDLDGDGRADLVFMRNDGSASAWLMNGLAMKASGPLLDPSTAGWNVVGMADLDGDGAADLLWRRGPGDYGAWRMRGLQAAAYAALSPGNGAELVP